MCIRQRTVPVLYLSHITRKRVFGDFRPGKVQTSLFSYRSYLESWNFGYSKNTYQTILSKNKKYPGNIFHAWVNRSENTLLLNACLATLTIWLCRMPVHFGFLCKCWNKGCFKHKKGSFLLFFFHRWKPWKLQNLDARKGALYWQKSRKVRSDTKKPVFSKMQCKKSLLVCVSWPKIKC